MIKVKNVLQSMHIKRQILYGILDLNYHILDQNTAKFNVEDIYRKWHYGILKEYPIEITFKLASFGHIMGGYDAGYYGYLRAETYAAAMYYMKFKNGKELDTEVGKEYRNKILAKGASVDSIELLKDFLQDEPDEKYFMMDKGLI